MALGYSNLNHKLRVLSVSYPRNQIYKTPTALLAAGVLILGQINSDINLIVDDVTKRCRLVRGGDLGKSDMGALSLLYRWGPHFTLCRQFRPI